MDLSNRKIAFHIHTKYSFDCESEPSKIVDTLFNLGVYTAIITDHNTIIGAEEARNYAEKKYGAHFNVIVGEEVLTDIGDIIGFPIISEIPMGNYQDVINEMKRQNAKICLPHPYKSHDLFLIHQDEFIHQFDFIEIYNSRIKNTLNEYAEMLNNKFKKIPIIGNDAHTIEDLANCYIKYDDKMGIIDSLTKPTLPKNIRKSQRVNAKSKKQKFQYLKYSILALLNK